MLPKQYDPSELETKLFKQWESAGYFSRNAGGHANPEAPPYTIVIPPPNVTGVLHMGHALNNTLQDILTRRARMQGRPTRWIVGTDHAGIATQNKVEQKLAASGKTRFDLGREAFVEECWQWRSEYGSTIIEQLKAMGCSCDYNNEKFTMDASYAAAIRKVFVSWYRAGRIYRGNRIINWCPRCTTALADDEVEHKDEQGSLWHIRYPLLEPVGDIKYLVVATTRPETMLGDTGVAVALDDERYSELLNANAKVCLPLTDRVIPIFADEYVDKNFGTGAVKVTPAHDPNDFEMGKRHNLPEINIFNEHAIINANGGIFAGMERYEARAAILQALEDLGLLEKTDTHDHAVGHCYRCDTTIEPWASEQWFVSMAPLAKPAIKAVRDGRISFNPKRWEKVYFQWMESIRDWCISRQLWWGHRIPVFYCDACGWQDASETDLQKCPSCGSALRQDEDVLDTWFSSQLWPFATASWPADDAQDPLKTYYPTQVLSTARDIIFLWVARMIMSSLYFVDEQIPFRDVIIHPTVLDKHGNIMSKSRGNGIDPLELISDFGADAMRFGLALQVTGAQDMKFDRDKLASSRNFATKIWNAARFVLMNLEDFQPATNDAQNTAVTSSDSVEKNTAVASSDSVEKNTAVASSDSVEKNTAVTSSDSVEKNTTAVFAPVAQTDADRWILSRLAALALELDDESKSFDFGAIARGLYAFFWNEFCDWYIEFAKGQLADASLRRSTQQILVFVLDNALRLLHPFMPFVTEEIWQSIPHGCTSPHLIVAPYPQTCTFAGLHNFNAESGINDVIAIVQALRSTRARYAISPKQSLDVYISLQASEHASKNTYDDASKNLCDCEVRLRSIHEQGFLINKLANCDNVNVTIGGELPGASSVTVVNGMQIAIVLDGLIDFNAEQQRLQKELQKQVDALDKLRRKLSNEGFLAKAASDVIQKSKDDFAELELTVEQIKSQLAGLKVLS
ncbi:MAG: valine--tRNA ligase [Coriobacteriales bacterium]|jgi:valyl-tRNA synthetase|nr:valine--tRNA ligase [Coriobacteriales bacterium]